MFGSIFLTLSYNQLLAVFFIPMIVPIISIIIYSKVRHIQQMITNVYYSLFAGLYAIYLILLLSFPWWWAIIAAPAVYFLMKVYLDSMLRISKADLLGLNKKYNEYKENKQNKSNKKKP
jgi:Ca2+/Na+ antiporter